MKNKIVLPLLLIPILLLSACGSAATQTSTRPGSNNAQGNTSQQELPLSEKLAIGTLKLEGTANAVTTKQAADLLPLWQGYNSLLASDTAAQEGKDALAQQIQEAMTSDQIKAIDNLNLTQRDIFASMQELGITTSSQVNANGTAQPSGEGFPGGGGFGGGVPGGGVPGGGPGGGAPSGGGGAQLDPSQIATAQARRSAGGGGGDFNSSRLLTPLVAAVIKLLESKS